MIPKFMECVSPEDAFYELLSSYRHSYLMGVNGGKKLRVSWLSREREFHQFESYILAEAKPSYLLN